MGLGWTVVVLLVAGCLGGSANVPGVHRAAEIGGWTVYVESVDSTPGTVRMEQEPETHVALVIGNRSGEAPLDFELVSALGRERPLGVVPGPSGWTDLHGTLPLFPIPQGEIARGVLQFREMQATPRTLILHAGPRQAEISLMSGGRDAPPQRSATGPLVMVGTNVTHGQIRFWLQDVAWDHAQQDFLSIQNGTPATVPHADVKVLSRMTNIGNTALDMHNASYRLANGDGRWLDQRFGWRDLDAGASDGGSGIYLNPASLALQEPHLYLAFGREDVGVRLELPAPD